MQENIRRDFRLKRMSNFNLGKGGSAGNTRRKKSKEEKGIETEDI